MASREFPRGPGVKAANTAAQALIDLIQRTPLSDVPVLEKGVFNDIFASGEPPSIADVLSMLVPGQDVLDFIPGSLFGLGRRARKSPFFHGTKAENRESILEEGFTQGRSAELNLPGTSVTRDPMVAQEMFAEDNLADLVLGVDIPDEALKEIRNLSPSEFLRSAEILEEMGATNFPTGVSKPGVFFRESESFFPRVEGAPKRDTDPFDFIEAGPPGTSPRFVDRPNPPGGPASRLNPRDMTPDEVLLQQHQNVVEAAAGAEKRGKKLVTSLTQRGGHISEGNIAKTLAAQLRGPRSQVDRNVGRAIELLDELIKKVPVGTEGLSRGEVLTLTKARPLRGRIQRVENAFRQVQAAGRTVDNLNGIVKTAANANGVGVRTAQLSGIVESVASTNMSHRVTIRFHPSFKTGTEAESRVVTVNLPKYIAVDEGETVREILSDLRAPLDDWTRTAQQNLQDIIKQLETGRLVPPVPNAGRAQRVRDILERQLP